MNFELFISKKLLASKKYKNSISAPIVKIGILSIAIGVVVMLIAIATGLGLQHKIRDKITGFNGAIQVVNFGANNTLNSMVPIEVDTSFYKLLYKNPDITHVQSFALKSGIIKTKTDFEGVILKGVDANYHWHYFDDYLVAGKLPVYGDEISQEMILSKNIADKLQLKVGDAVNIWFLKEDLNKPPSVKKLIISGLYSTGFPDFDKNFALADIRHIQKINKWSSNQIGGLELFVKTFDAIESINKKVYQSTPPHLTTISVLDSFPLIFEWIKLFDSNISAIIFIMVLIAGFNVITTLLVFILEQTRMIGTLKALGANNWQIRKIFMYQATYMVIKGLIYGNLIGIGLILIQKYTGFIHLNPETYHVHTAPVYLKFVHIFLLNVGVLVITYLMLLLPSYYITKISPVRAIKFE